MLTELLRSHKVGRPSITNNPGIRSVTVNYENPILHKHFVTKNSQEHCTLRHHALTNSVVRANSCSKIQTSTYNSTART